MDYPDPKRHPKHYEAHEAAPVDVGDKVNIKSVAGAGWLDEDDLPNYEVVSIDPPNGLSCRNDYVLRVRHDNPPYMADGFSDTVLCTQLRRGKSWDTIDN